MDRVTRLCICSIGMQPLRPSVVYAKAFASRLSFKVVNGGRRTVNGDLLWCRKEACSLYGASMTRLRLLRCELHTVLWYYEGTYTRSELNMTNTLRVYIVRHGQTT